MATSGTRTPAVLFIMHRRADLAARVFAAIREARPSQLFLAADGPRADIPGEEEACKRTRSVIESMIDWDCEVHRDYSERNLGVRDRPASAITWAFGKVEQLMILEDDCLPSPCFFPFCAELLERYAQDERVGMISGSLCVAQQDHPLPSPSYHFAWDTAIWGWATWRRAWKNYDADLSDWAQRRKTDWLIKFLGDPKMAKFWKRTFDCHAKIDAWDHQWYYTRWKNSQLGVMPSVNLISNLGFRQDASHTTDMSDHAAQLALEDMHFPLQHPEAIVADKGLERAQFRFLHSKTAFDLWWAYQRDKRLRRIIPWIAKK